jgi:hypothetical protein
MSSCSPMNFNFSCSATTLVNYAQEEVTQHGGTFNGNTSSGSFSFKSPAVVGNYSINGQSLTVNITQEPFLLPCVLIEKAIQGGINGLS